MDRFHLLRREHCRTEIGEDTKRKKRKKEKRNANDRYTNTNKHIQTSIIHRRRREMGWPPCETVSKQYRVRKRSNQWKTELVPSLAHFIIPVTRVKKRNDIESLFRHKSYQVRVTRASSSNRIYRQAIQNRQVGKIPTKTRKVAKDPLIVFVCLLFCVSSTSF